MAALSSPADSPHIRGDGETSQKAEKTEGPSETDARQGGAAGSTPATPDALADLLNPAINKGTAGLGSGTGKNPNLKPPPDNSFDRRADFSAAHKARKSTPNRGQGLRRGAAARLHRLADHRARSAVGEGVGTRRRRRTSSPSPAGGGSRAEASGVGCAAKKQVHPLPARCARRPPPSRGR